VAAAGWNGGSFFANLLDPKEEERVTLCYLRWRAAPFYLSSNGK
jgi:hypothetical protein